MIINTINDTYSGEFKILNSKFIGYLLPFQDKNLLADIISNLKKEHPKARHICYAYRLGFENEEYRANDDGEPSGTAGKPILNQLYSKDLKNCILLVVRYFGGTKLGVPGLIDAYKNAAIACLNQAEIIQTEEFSKLELKIEQELYYELISILKTNNINIVNTSFDTDKYILNLDIPKSKLDIIQPFNLK